MKGRKVKKQEKESLDLELLKNQLARALADYDNLRKRVEKEREDLRQLAALKIIAKLLSVYDMFVSAQKHLNDSGLAIAIGEFRKVFEEEGVMEIEVKKGELFDASVHEAVEVTEDKNLKDGEILEVLLSGWKFKDGLVIRHAKVKVNKIKKN